MTDASAEDLYEQAKQFIVKQQYDTARALLEASLLKQPMAQSAHDLGVLNQIQGRKEEAIVNFEQAVDIDPKHVASYKNAAEIFLELGQALPALGCYGQAMQAAPDDRDMKEKFVSLARACRFTQFNPELKELYQLCLDDPELDFTNMGSSWFSLLQSDPNFGPVYTALDKKDYATFQKAFSKLSPQEANNLLDPFFITGMNKQIRVPQVAFERFLTHLRHALLDGLKSDKLPFSDKSFIALATAIARYCFTTEYVFFTTDEEKEAIKEFTVSANDMKKISIAACYLPLHQLQNAIEIESSFKDTTLDAVIRLQITDHFRQEDIKKTIESVTETTSGVSTMVKDMYEMAPYPRWVNYNRIMYDEQTEGFLRGKKPQILVAGCGTGHEAIELAHVFPDGHVLAIDLSFSSLAYGISKAEDYGIKNITFKQGDILKLDQIDQQFDYVASSGVLHHMADPEGGWDVVTGLLKPGGLMRIALYSKHARESLETARGKIKTKGYGSTNSEIRRFRNDASKLLKERDFKNIANYVDYYSLSECRDLLFHVQEDQFTLPRVKAYLDKNNLKFLGFYVSDDIIAEYRQMFADDYMTTDLDNWEVFEKLNPDTFNGMYRLWIKKPE